MACIGLNETSHSSPSMKAPVSQTWLRRQFLITFFSLAMGLWFFYDGKIGFPKKNERFLAHQTFVQANNKSWEEYARSRGWPKRVPERLYKKADIAMQYVLGAASLIGGLLALRLLLKGLNSFVHSDAEAYYNEIGKRIPFSAITSIDKRKWDSKGIAVLTYVADGRQSKAVIDDYKFVGADRILAQAEAVLESSF